MMKKVVYVFTSILCVFGNINAQAPVLVKDIVSGGNGSFPQQLIDVEGTLFFIANDNVHGNELWKSDGTEAGTVLVKDIVPPNNYGQFYWLTNVNGLLFFTVDDGVHGNELWKSDGTEAGTVMVKDINPNSYNPSPPSNFVVVGNTLYFTVNDGVHGNELWKSDGTAAGTNMVIDITSSNYSGLYPGIYLQESNTQHGTVANLNDTLYFLADDYNNRRGLWRSDGTPAGTVFVKEVKDYGAYLDNVNGTLYFIGGDFGAAFGGELWKSDGTSAGTVMIKDINPGTGSSTSTSHNYSDGSLRVFPIGNTIYFEADSDGNYSRELWKTDGTEVGTSLVKDLDAGSSGSKVSYCTNFNNTLFFTGTDGNSNHGRELWKSDGTEVGTVMVNDIVTGTSSSDPRFLVNYNDKLYFNAYNTGYGQTLWESDGSEAGTVPFTTNNFSGGRYLTISNNKLYFAGDAKNNSGYFTGSELYYLDLSVSPVSVNELENKILTVSPNPSGGVFTIAADITGSGVVEVYSHTGIKLVSENVESFTKATIDISNQASGIYLVKITSSGNVWIQKIIIE